MKLSKNHGGKRTDAGRPKGAGQYGSATKVMRVPESKVEDVKVFLAGGSASNIPLNDTKVSVTVY